MPHKMRLINVLSSRMNMMKYASGATVATVPASAFLIFICVSFLY